MAEEPPSGQEPPRTIQPGMRLPGVEDEMDSLIWQMRVPERDKESVERMAREQGITEAQVRRQLIAKVFEGEAE